MKSGFDLSGINKSLGQATWRLQKAVTKLSSAQKGGSLATRISGFKTAELLRSGVAEYGQAVRRANDGISMLQTADGALEAISEKLAGMKNLAFVATSGSPSDDTRRQMDDAYQALAGEISALAATTSFNGTKLLDGSLTDTPVDLGGGSSLNISLPDVSSKALGVEGSLSDPSRAGELLGAVDQALHDVVQLRDGVSESSQKVEGSLGDLGNLGERLSATRSRIKDEDIASAMVGFTRTEILGRARVAWEAQANAEHESVLNLLK